MGDNNEAFMEDFEDSLNDEGDPYQMKNARNAAEALDTSLQAPNANDFSNARLIEEVRRSGPCRTGKNNSREGVNCVCMYHEEYSYGYSRVCTCITGKLTIRCVLCGVGLQILHAISIDGCCVVVLTSSNCI